MTSWQRVRTHICIILTVGTCVIALLWLIMIDVIRNERHAAIVHAQAEANNLSAAFQGELCQTLNSVARAMAVVADHMRAAHGPFDVHEWAADIPLLATAAIQAGIIGPDGRVVSSTLEAHPAPIDLSDREHFRVHLDGTFKGLFISKPVTGRVSKQVTIQISRRLEDKNGKFIGVLVFSLQPGYLTTLHKSVDFGPHGTIALIGPDNVIRARFNRNSPDGLDGIGRTIDGDVRLADAPPGGSGSYIHVSSV
ncbi:MAG: hypothetical protein ABSE20_17255, partial [Acetobacteraceae bacterium]